MIDYTIQNYCLDDILALKESYEIECKSAQGKDGKGKVPDSFWDTYSSFANTEGGQVYLGLKEVENGFEVLGIKDMESLKKDLFSTANNVSKVSVNLLDNNDVESIQIDGKTVIRVNIKPASRKNKPVFIGANPLIGSYMRLNDSDCLIPQENVVKMLAERGESSFDSRILKGYSNDDLDLNSINSYRSLFASLSPTHPYVAQEFNEFMRSIGAYRRDRETNEEGYTVAGLLMFGKLRAIQDEFPNYILDYQEREDSSDKKRWIDRITLDGSWSGNLFDFYMLIYKKLVSDIKIPFSLDKGTRKDETPIHEAIREALVNAIIHADYSERVSVLAVKRPDMFGFRNPGLMRVPPEQAVEGGDSDCRNRTIQKMFQFIGASEQAGSGVPRIFQNWKQQLWRKPKISQKREPNQTLFELHMASLIPEKTISELKALFGDKFNSFTDLQRLILSTAFTEDIVDHKRLCEITSEHPSDISKCLTLLVRDGLLKSEGAGRGTRYFPPNSFYSEINELIRDSNYDPVAILEENSGGLSSSTGGLSSSTGGLSSNTSLVDKIRKKPEDDIFTDEELLIAYQARIKKKLNKGDMEHIILKLCEDKPQTLERLSKLLDRAVDFLRSNYINPLLKQDKLKYDKEPPKHPQQAYSTVK